MEILLKSEKETEGINTWQATVNETASSFIASFMKIIRHTYNKNHIKEQRERNKIFLYRTNIVLQEEKHITKDRTL